ncbi:MAG TPA: thioredoxin-like domain-containing protein [Anaeromyxobacteraceae bacterium]|nr:thioredoxin-like domain-containing protein [Anaeromyxobacteraceae bacterium]
MAERIARPHRLLLGSVVTLSTVLLAAGGNPLENLFSHPNPGGPMASDAGPMPMHSQIPTLAGASGWLNSPPLTPEGLQGNVVLVDFWTYTCINWRRTLPYLKAWAQRYGNSGLVLVGVHTPEFPFEHDLDNVRQQAKEIGVNYPSAIDNEYAVWRAFHNQYWPALYVFDTQGRLRHHQFGEGGYAETEKVIQKLLSEAGRKDIDPRPTQVTAGGYELAADWSKVGSYENYLGAARTDGFASPGGSHTGERRQYTLPASLGLNDWALSGTWTVDDERVRLEAVGGRIAYRFRARDVNLIMGPATRRGAVRFRVLLDGKPPGPSHGLDVDEAGNGTANEQRMYQLIRQPGSIVDRRFEIEFLDVGAEAFDFTFG